MRREKGAAAVELAAAVMLLLVPVTLLVLVFAPWVQRQSLTRSAAAEAARMVVLSDDMAAPDEVGAAELVKRMSANHGIDPAEVQARFCGLTCAPLSRGELVTVEVTVGIPAVVVPGFGVSVGGGSWTASHTEPVDLYRSSRG